MYSVWFESELYGESFLFVSGIPTYDLAERIANNLVDEGFVARSWFEKD